MAQELSGRVFNAEKKKEQLKLCKNGEGHHIKTACVCVWWVCVCVCVCVCMCVCEREREKDA